MRMHIFTPAVTALLGMATIGCWSSQSLTPAASTPERVGYGLSSHTLNAGLSSASVVAIGNASHSIQGPGDLADSRWSVETFGLAYCRHAGDAASCAPVVFEGGEPPDIPRIIDPGMAGSFLVTDGTATATTIGADLESTRDSVSRELRPLANRGIWVTATFTLYFCSVQQAGPSCKQARVGADPVPGVVLATTVLRRGAELGGALWTTDLFGKVVRCEAWADGQPHCANATFTD